MLLNRLLRGGKREWLGSGGIPLIENDTSERSQTVGFKMYIKQSLSNQATDESGCDILAVGSWLWDPGCQLLVVRSWHLSKDTQRSNQRTDWTKYWKANEPHGGRSPGRRHIHGYQAVSNTLLFV